jgi:hypothetical protein
MRRILLVIGLLLGAACYIAWPFHTAWSIKEAVKSGDSTYLAQHFEWAPVKETLKASMADLVLGPTDTALEDKPQRQGLWANFKAYYGRNMVNGMVERYATPTGLSTLFGYGRTVSVNVLGREDPDKGVPLPQRIADAWSRVERATFVTPTRLEIDMRDEFEPDRIYSGVLELMDWRWKVTELRVRQHQSQSRTPRLTNLPTNR